MVMIWPCEQDKIMIESGYQNQKGEIRMQIRPVSDLRNHYPEVESQVLHSGQPVFLTKNGYGSMVLLSLEQYSALTQDIGAKLKEADAQAAGSSVRLSDEEVFSELRERINGHRGT